jgi:hypothetical protein
MGDCTTLLGMKVTVLPHKKLVEKYYGLQGTIVGYKIEALKKRDLKGDVIRTSETEELWTVEFDDEVRKEKKFEIMSTINLYRDMFSIGETK